MKWIPSLLPALALALPGLASAGTVMDPTGDWWTAHRIVNGVPTDVAYDGSRAGDMDVIDASAVFNVTTRVFTIVAKMNGDIGTTANSRYVWGVNTGSGTAGFASSGLNGVLFNRTIVIDPGADGAATTNVAGTSAFYNGMMLTLMVQASALTSFNGFTPEDYTWNLWPRDVATSVTQTISDFAPDNSNISTTAVPEPASLALVGLAGLGVIVTRRRVRPATEPAV